MPSTLPTTQVQLSLPGPSRLIAVASRQFPRYSEADIIELTDGRLLLVVTRKEGADDFSDGDLIGLFSADGGRSWDDQPHLVHDAFDDVSGLMSVSLCRSPRGLHCFFLARGPQSKQDTRIYQILSADEGKTWSAPVRVSQRDGYHIVNNARVIRTNAGRMIVPVAFSADRAKASNVLQDFCLYTDDDGLTWKQSNELALAGEPLMEPGVADCADGSLYMTIRTRLGVLYESRSIDGGATWDGPHPTQLPSPAAPSTVFRDPESSALWMFWINRAKGTWKDRTPLSLAISRDNGKTWGPARDIENDPKHGYGYVSVDMVKDRVLLTYYDWHDTGQRNFENTNLRQRTIPLAWIAGHAAPPMFRTTDHAVLAEDGKIVSANSGLLIEPDCWRLWYTVGELGPKGEMLSVRYAESRDAGFTWQKSADPNPLFAGTYHASVHRDGGQIIVYAWRREDKDDSGLYRFISTDDGTTFEINPPHPLIAAWWSKPDRIAHVGEGRVSNDAFDIIRNDRGTWEYFAACMEKATDPRTIVKHDNAAGWSRLIGRAASADGVTFSPIEIIISPDFAGGDSFDTQFYGLQVFRYRGFYLGLLHTYFAESQIIQPEWAWSHDGKSWNRTRVPCISLGDEGAFDSRMIVFGAVTISKDELVWLYAGSDWRHNAFKAGKVTSAIGRATIPLRELDAWVDSLPRP